MISFIFVNYRLIFLQAKKDSEQVINREDAPPPKKQKKKKK